jgi:major membrane immunogen (membrane-anchored lipoprotein)
MAFVIVPPSVDPDDAEKKEEEATFPPPYLADLGPQIVRMNGTISWKAGDIVIVPSGKPARILSATATNSDGAAPMADSSTLTYTPAKDFRGQSAVTFEVTDGESADDPKGRKAFLTIPVTVGDPNFEDVPPTFTPRTVQLEAGEAAQQVDLRQSSGHPSDKVLQELSYNGLQGQSADFSAGISGSTLTVSSPLGVQPGTKTTLTFTVDYTEFSVPGSIDVEVVSSSRPKAVPRDDGPFEMQPGQSQTFDVLANDLNPFEAEGIPLRVIDAQIDQLSVGSTASTSFTSTGVTVKTGPSFTGELSVVYRVQDGTKDPTREVQGRITVIVRAAPDAPAQPQATAGDGAASVRWQAPATNNSPILDYTVSWSGGSKTFPAGAAGSYQPIPGLTNGQGYAFTVTARNKIGNSPASAASATVTPYGTPSPPRNVVISKGGDAPTTLRMDWNAPSTTGGGAIHYLWRLNGGAWQKTSATSASTGGAGAGTWTVDVLAVNEGSNQRSAPNSASVVVNDPPPPQPSGSIGKGGSMACGSGGGGCAEVRISWNNMDAGTYRVFATINGSSCCSYQQTVDIGASGRLQLQNHLGIRQAGETIAVRFENVSGGTSRTLGAISGTQWNNIGYNTW